MTDKLFCKLWKDALDQTDKELYIAEYGYPEWFDEIGQDVSEINRVLGNIHDIAHMSIRDMIAVSGLSQAAFALKLCIPLRTVEDWATERRKCTDYNRLSYARNLGLIPDPAGK